MSRRGKGEGTIFEQKKTRKDGTIYSRWCCEIVTGYDKYNDKIVKRVYGKDKQEVIEKKNELLAQQQKGLLPETKNITLNKYIDHWLESRKTDLKNGDLKIRTYDSYKSTYELHIKNDELGKKQIQTIKTANINSFLNKISRNLSDSSVKRIRSILSNIFNYAFSEEIIVINPVTHAKKVAKVNRHEIRVLSKEEITSLLDCAKEYIHKKRKKLKTIYQIVLLALASGMRKGELLALKFENIDTENNTISIKENIVEIKKDAEHDSSLSFGRPKSNASIRTIAIDGFVIEELMKLQSNNPLVFHTFTGKPISPSDLYREFKHLLEECKLNGKGIRFHDLRHTHATQLLAAGVNIKQISARLGHEDVRITLQTYSHFLPVLDRQAATIMGDMLK